MAQNPTIVFTQGTMFEIFKQSALKFKLNDSAKIYVTDNHGVLEVQHFAPEEITPGGVPKVSEEHIYNLEVAGKD